MGVGMKVNGATVSMKEKENIGLQTDRYMKESLKMEKQMDLECILEQLGLFIKEIGLMIYSQDKEKNIQMVF